MSRAKLFLSRAPMNLVKRCISGYLRTLGYKLQRISLSELNESAALEEALKSASSRNPIVIDIGTHKGAFIDCVLDICRDAEIFGFEPIPELFKDLERKYEKSSNVKIQNCAVGRETDTKKFFVHSHTDSSSLLPSESEYLEKYPNQMAVDREILVSVEPLDSISIASDRQIALIKIDVQGYEGEVLEGARDLLKRCDFLILEGALVPSYEDGIMIDKLCHLLVSEGFRLRYAYNVYAASADFFWART